MADHGEMLGEKFQLLRHGGRGYRERIHAPIGIRFGTQSNKFKQLAKCNPLDDDWSAAEYRELLLKMFPDAFEELFPGVTAR